MVLNGDKGGFDEADSGEDEGEGSVNIGEECVVVGEEAVDSVAIEVTLPRWCIEKIWDGCGYVGF